MKDGVCDSTTFDFMANSKTTKCDENLWEMNPHSFFKSCRCKKKQNIETVKQ